MNKIIQLSEYGFKLDQNPDKWVSCDKKFYSSKDFKSLKVGDIIAKMSMNDKNFVVSVSLVSLGESTRSGGLSSTPIKSPLNNSESIPPLPVTIYLECVKIAFHSIMISGFSDEKRGIDYAFDRADLIYEEFNKRCKYE